MQDPNKPGVSSVPSLGTRPPPIPKGGKKASPRRALRNPGPELASVPSVAGPGAAAKSIARPPLPVAKPIATTLPLGNAGLGPLPVAKPIAATLPLGNAGLGPLPVAKPIAATLPLGNAGLGPLPTASQGMSAASANPGIARAPQPSLGLPLPAAQPAAAPVPFASPSPVAPQFAPSLAAPAIALQAQPVAPVSVAAQVSAPIAPMGIAPPVVSPNSAPMPVQLSAVPQAPGFGQPMQQPAASTGGFAAPPMSGAGDALYIPQEPPDEGWGKLGIAMVGMTLLFAGGVAYFIATSGSSETGNEETAQTNAAASELDEGEEIAVAPVESDASLVVETVLPQPSAALDAGQMAATLDASLALAVAETGSLDASSVAVSPISPQTPSPEASEGATGLLRANGEIDRPAGLVSLVIESEPAGAIVIRKRDSVKLGVTPFQYDVESESGKTVFVLQKEGYRSVVVTMPANRDGIRQVNLLPGKSANIAISNVSEVPPKNTNTQTKKPPKTASPKQRARGKTATKDRKPRKRKPPKTSKPKSQGKVDYNADAIPFD